MGHRVLGTLRAVAGVIAVGLVGVAPTVAQTPAPRTPWGHPDLQGIWDFRTITPLERPADQADREFLTEEEATALEQAVVERNLRLLNQAAERAPAGANVDFRADGAPAAYNNFWFDQGTTTVATRRTSLVVDPPDGRIPDLTPGAQRRGADRQAYRREHPADSWLDRSASDRCLLGFNAGPPIISLAYNQNLQLFQTPDHVVLLTEMIHTVRVVPLGVRAPLPAGLRQWSGAARGRWEGETLVVETTNFDAARGWRGSTEHMRLVERFTRLDADTLEYTFTAIDPQTWTREWTASTTMRWTDLPLYEYACHEGNHSLPNILAGQRATEEAGRGVPKAR